MAYFKSDHSLLEVQTWFPKLALAVIYSFRLGVMVTVHIYILAAPPLAAAQVACMKQSQEITFLLFLLLSTTFEVGLGVGEVSPSWP